MASCKAATRPHTHPGKGWIRAEARDHSWEVTVVDDGSICQRDYGPPEERHIPQHWKGRRA